MFRFDKDKLRKQIAKINGIKKIKINTHYKRKQNTTISDLTDMLYRIKHEVAVIHELEKKIN